MISRQKKIIIVIRIRILGLKFNLLSVMRVWSPNASAVIHEGLCQLSQNTACLWAD